MTLGLKCDIIYIVKEKETNKMKVINKILIALMVIGLLWLTLSTIDVMTHNNPASENFGNYAFWNFWDLM